MNGMKYALLVLAVIASVAWAVPAGQSRQESTPAPKQSQPSKDDAPAVPAVVKETPQPAANVTVGKPQEAPKNQSSVAAPAAAKDSKDQRAQQAVSLSAASADSASDVKSSGKVPEPESAQVDDLVGSPFSVEFEGMQGDQPVSIESAEFAPASAAAGVVQRVDAKEQQSALPVVVVEQKPAASGAKADSSRDAWGSMIDGIIGQLQDLKRKTRALEELAHRK